MEMERLLQHLQNGCAMFSLYAVSNRNEYQEMFLNEYYWKGGVKNRSVRRADSLAAVCEPFV
jgi:hypothetical protein